MKYLLTIFLCVQAFAGTARHVVASGGVASGNALDSATGWTLTYAASTTTIQPGDTVYLHTGTYPSHVDFTRSGTASQPIIYRNYNNQYVALDGGTDNYNHAVVVISANYVWLWGLRITSSATTKDNGNNGGGSYSWPTNILQPEGIMTNNSAGSGLSHDCKLIHCVVDNNRQGLSSWIESKNIEVYGCVFFSNGWRDDQGTYRGHNWYIQTKEMEGTKKFIANVNSLAYGEGFQAYGSQCMDSLYFDKNTFIDNLWSRNFIISIGDVHASTDDFIRDNQSYQGSATNMFYVTHPVGYVWDSTARFTFTNNRMWSTGTFTWNWVQRTTMTVSGNCIRYGSFNADDPSTYGTNNTWTSSNPTGWDTVVVIPSTYESKRALVTVWNTAGANTASIPCTFLTSGDAYEVRDVQNYYGALIASGTYSGSPISVSLTSTAIPAKIGDDPRTIAHTDKRFNCFVVSSTTAGAAPEQTSAPTVTSPIYTGATSVSGTSESGASVDVYVNLASVGTTNASGTSWTKTVSALSLGNTVKAKATASGKTESEFSNTVTVSASPATSTKYLIVRHK